jgi:hypothetical protein
MSCNDSPIQSVNKRQAISKQLGHTSLYCSDGTDCRSELPLSRLLIESFRAHRRIGSRCRSRFTRATSNITEPTVSSLVMDQRQQNRIERTGWVTGIIPTASHRCITLRTLQSVYHCHSCRHGQCCFRLFRLLITYGYCMLQLLWLSEMTQWQIGRTECHSGTSNLWPYRGQVFHNSTIRLRLNERPLSPFCH